MLSGDRTPRLICFRLLIAERVTPAKFGLGRRIEDDLVAIIASCTSHHVPYRGPLTRFACHAAASIVASCKQSWLQMVSSDGTSSEFILRGKCSSTAQLDAAASAPPHCGTSISVSSMRDCMGYWEPATDRSKSEWRQAGETALTW
jgi:hypothetical protein